MVRLVGKVGRKRERAFTCSQCQDKKDVERKHAAVASVQQNDRQRKIRIRQL
jgi:hypothetical protein